MDFNMFFENDEDKSMLSKQLSGQKSSNRGRKRCLDHLTLEEKMQRKKMKNREAAQVSRDRKKEKFEKMEKTLNEYFMANKSLNENNKMLRKQNEQLQSEISELRKKLNALLVTNKTADCLKEKAAALGSHIGSAEGTSAIQNATVDSTNKCRSAYRYSSDSAIFSDFNDNVSISDLLNDINFEATPDFDFCDFEDFTSDLYPALSDPCENEVFETLNSFKEKNKTRKFKESTERSLFEQTVTSSSAITTPNSTNYLNKCKRTQRGIIESIKDDLEGETYDPEAEFALVQKSLSAKADPIELLDHEGIIKSEIFSPPMSPMLPSKTSEFSIFYSYNNSTQQLLDFNCKCIDDMESFSSS